jgi:hypothetical protein
MKLSCLWIVLMKLIILGFEAFDFDEKSIFRVHQYFLQYYNFKTILGFFNSCHKPWTNFIQLWYSVSTLEILCVINFVVLVLKNNFWSLDVSNWIWWQWNECQCTIVYCVGLFFAAVLVIFCCCVGKLCLNQFIMSIVLYKLCFAVKYALFWHDLVCFDMLWFCFRKICLYPRGDGGDDYLSIYLEAEKTANMFEGWSRVALTSHSCPFPFASKLPHII